MAVYNTTTILANEKLGLYGRGARDRYGVLYAWMPDGSIMAKRQGVSVWRRSRALLNASVERQRQYKPFRTAEVRLSWRAAWPYFKEVESEVIQYTTKVEGKNVGIEVDKNAVWIFGRGWSLQLLTKENPLKRDALKVVPRILTKIDEAARLKFVDRK